MPVTAYQALWLLLPAFPIAMWIAWSDLSEMKITNKSVLLLAACFILLAPFVLPADVFLWRLGQMAVVLVVGFLMNALRLIGGGDAKYAAVMAGFFDFHDYPLIIMLFGVVLMAAFLTHRLARSIPAVRHMTPNWKSWTAGKDFPMGLALSGTLIIYLVLMVVRG